MLFNTSIFSVVLRENPIEGATIQQTQFHSEKYVEARYLPQSENAFLLKEC